MIEIAQKYIEAGFSILPIKKDKSPAVPKWAGVKFNPADFEGAKGIGIKCGKESNGLECFDFDNHFGDAKQTLSQFLNTPEVKTIYENYKLPIQSTQNGGFHLLYRCKVVDGNKKLASRPLLDETKSKWRPDAIIETRGDGGYFCAYPTDGYKVIRNDIFTVPEITPDERKTLIETALSFNQWSEPIKSEYESTNKPGDIYNSKPEAIEEMKSALLSAGWSEIGRYTWRRPGKKEGISATIGKVADNVFYCFSSNAHPFNPMAGYTPFQVVCLLKHNSDFKSFAKEISDRYRLGDYRNTKPGKQAEITQKTETEYVEILSKAFVDVNIPVEKPPIILEINHNDKNYPQYERLLTLGNMSVFTGKGKSKKTFLTTLMLSCLAINGQMQRKFRATLPESKRQILQFDTEQGEYDTYLVARRIHDLSGGYQQHLGTFNLREHEPYDRIGIIQAAINKFKSNLGFVMIDGIADLVVDINDNMEAAKISTLLMQWTKIYNIHISNVIHQNKNDNYATGHLGSALIKKSEVVIGVETDLIDKSRSIVSCQNIRGARDFEDFAFKINENTMPEIEWDWLKQKLTKGYDY
jgi:hypothetical protein